MEKTLLPGVCGGPLHWRNDADRVQHRFDTVLLHLVGHRCLCAVPARPGSVQSRRYDVHVSAGSALDQLHAGRAAVRDVSAGDEVTAERGDRYLVHTDRMSHARQWHYQVRWNIQYDVLPLFC